MTCLIEDIFCFCFLSLPSQSYAAHAWIISLLYRSYSSIETNKQTSSCLGRQMAPLHQNILHYNLHLIPYRTIRIIMCNYIIEYKINHALEFYNHSTNRRLQYKLYRKLRKEMATKDVLIHIDFASNYTRSRVQNTGDITHRCILCRPKQPAFCTISNSLEHRPAVIWTYLKPILDGIQCKHHVLETVHLFSDEPCPQYCQKGNISYSLKLLQLED